MEDLEKLLKEFGVGQRPMNDPFFDNTYKTCKVFERKGVIAEDEEELCHKFMEDFQCNACNAVFQNLLDYELHYHDIHQFTCSQCKKWKPTPRLLEIHIQEMHDNYFKVLSEKKPMYECFVSECDIKFKTTEERTNHCREIHKFPKNYRFDDYLNIKKITENESSMDIEENKSCMDIQQNETYKKKNTQIHFGKHLSQKTFKKQNIKVCQPTDFKIANSQAQPNSSSKPATMFIPRQVQQKSYAKLLTQNQKMERNVLETESIMELEKSLPDN